MRSTLLTVIATTLLLSQFSLINCDWDDWMWGSDDEAETTTTEEPARFDDEAICDHDPLTLIILKFILETKKGMKSGNLTGMPPLDPFYIPVMTEELVGTKHNYRVIANLSDIYVKGLSDFNITALETNALDMSANLSFFLEKFAVSGKYHLKGTARMVIPFPVYGKGRVEIETSNINASSFVQIGFNDENDIVLKVSELDFALNIDKIKVQFKGLTGAMITKRWNEIINSMGLKMFRKMEPKMHDKIRARVILGVNKALKDMEYDWPMWMEVMKQTMACYFE